MNQEAKLTDKAAGAAVTETELQIAARDGYPLAATRRGPAAGEAHSTVLIAPAAAVPRGFYGRFAAYLAGRGFEVVSFDFRGVGGSRPASLRGFKARMRDWAELDLTAAIDFAAALDPARPLVHVGHSFGGQGLGLADNNTKVARALIVAAQAGYWGYMPRPERYRVLFFVGFLGPLVTRLMGRLPAGFGLGDGLPREVFLEWAGWLMRPGYLFDDATLASRANFPRYRGALRAIGFTDDPWATPVAIARLLQGYTGTRPEHLTIEPREVGASKIGHFGYFRPEHRDTLWRDAADWLSRRD